MSSVESQNYNTVLERIWDPQLKGFRPMTEREKWAANMDRLYGHRNWLEDMPSPTDKIQ